MDSETSVGVDSKAKSPLAMAKAMVAIAQHKQLTFLAAGVAYYAFVSLIPALLLALVVATTVGGAALSDRLIALTNDFLTPTGQEAITGAVVETPGASGATVVGGLFLMWGALKVFRALNTAFLVVYEQTETADFVGELADAALVSLGVGGGFLVMVGVGTLLAALPLGPFAWLVGIFGLPVVLTVCFLPMYHRFPNPPISLTRALPGAAVAAVGWTLLQAGFQLYAASAGQYQAYGVIGGVLLFVTWLYIAAIIVIVGAVINVVLAGRVDVDEIERLEATGETPDFRPPDD